MDAAAAEGSHDSRRHDLCGKEGRREHPWQPGKVSDDEGEMRGDSRGPALAFVSGADCRMQALPGRPGREIEDAVE